MGRAPRMRHLFLAPLSSAFGEALHGVRLALALLDAGHEVVFLGPARLHVLFEKEGEGRRLTFGRIDAALPRLDVEVEELLARLGCDTLVLVDAAAVGKAAAALRLDVAAFTRPGVPVVALDCWDLPPTPWVWDYGPVSEVLDPAFHALPRRLVPVPTAHPDVPGGYAALPRVARLSAAERAAEREALGVAAGERLVVWPTAPWQHVEGQANPVLGELARKLPGIIVPRLARLGAKVAHVGPWPLPVESPALRHLAPLPPPAFERLLGAADMLLGFNAIASSLATAVAARVPVLLGQLPRLRAWPLSLDGVLAGMMRDNPFYDALRVVDAADEDAFLGAARALLFEDAAAAAMRARQDAYAARVAALPGGVARFLSLLDEHQPA